jgi:hypothetical protein
MSKSLPAAGRQMPNECQIPNAKRKQFFLLNFGFHLSLEI